MEIVSCPLFLENIFIHTTMHIHIHAFMQAPLEDSEPFLAASRAGYRVGGALAAAAVSLGRQRGAGGHGLAAEGPREHAEEGPRRDYRMQPQAQRLRGRFRPDRGTLLNSTALLKTFYVVTITLHFIIFLHLFLKSLLPNLKILPKNYA